jgi:hypothetical protein
MTRLFCFIQTFQYGTGGPPFTNAVDTGGGGGGCLGWYSGASVKLGHLTGIYGRAWLHGDTRLRRQYFFIESYLIRRGNFSFSFISDRQRLCLCLTSGSALLWDVTQRWVVVTYRRFGTTYRSHLQGSGSTRRKPLTFRDNISIPYSRIRKYKKETTDVSGQPVGPIFKS